MKMEKKEIKTSKIIVLYIELEI